MWDPPALKPIPRPAPREPREWQAMFDAPEAPPDLPPEDPILRWEWELARHRLRSPVDGTWTTAAGYTVVGPPIHPGALVCYPKHRWAECRWAKYFHLSDTNRALRGLIGIERGRPSSWARIELGRTVDRNFPQLVRGIALRPYRGNWMHIRYYSPGELGRALKGYRAMLKTCRAREERRHARIEAKCAQAGAEIRRKLVSSPV